MNLQKHVVAVNKTNPQRILKIEMKIMQESACSSFSI